MFDDSKFTQQTYHLRNFAGSSEEDVLVVVYEYGNVILDYLTNEEILLSIYKEAIESNDTIRFSGWNEQEYYPLSLEYKDGRYEMEVERADG